MPDIKVAAPVRMASLSVVVTRADGTVEDHGTVAYYHKNPLKRLAWRVKHKLGRT